MAKYADEHRRDVQLNVGDLVYVSTEHLPLARQLSRKLAPRWVGPFPISAVISRVAFRVDLPVEYGRVHPVFHVSYLRPHVGPVPPQPPAPLPLDDAAAGEYEVEDILDSRLGRTGPEYLVKWVGYPIFESTWEPVQHLANAQDILSSFLSRRGRRSLRRGE